MKKRWLIAALAALVLVAVWGGWQMVRRGRTETLLENNYQRAFFSLLGHTENIEILLGKLFASSTPHQVTMMLTNIWVQSSAAQENMGQLPFVKLDLARSNKFLAQLGDFARFLADKTARGKTIADDEWEELIRLHTATGELSARLHDLQSRLSRGGFRRLAPGEPAPGVARAQEQGSLENGLQELDEFLQGVPSLLYDGPFSDHVEAREPVGLKGDRITEEEAERLARAFIGGERVKDVTTTVKEIPGPIPKFSVVFGPMGQRPLRQITIDISKVGGKALWFLDGAQPDRAEIRVGEAIEKARRFLDEKGFENLVTTGSLREGNALVVSFVPVEEDVIIYPDLLKVRVSMEDGAILGFDAIPYYLSHRERNLPEPELTEEDIRDLVNPRLEIRRIRKALIPLPSLREVLTYEVRGLLEEDEFLIYFNAVNGDEEAIMQVIETADGTLTL